MKIGGQEITTKGTYPLQRPIKFEGDEVTNLDYNLDDLKGKDLCAAARSIGGNPAERIILQSSPDYQAAVFACAAGKPIELIYDLYGVDFTEVTAITQLYLMASGSGETPPSP